MRISPFGLEDQWLKLYLCASTNLWHINLHFKYTHNLCPHAIVYCMRLHRVYTSNSFLKHLYRLMFPSPTSYPSPLSHSLPPTPKTLWLFSVLRRQYSFVPFSPSPPKHARASFHSVSAVVLLPNRVRRLSSVADQYTGFLNQRRTYPPASKTCSVHSLLYAECRWVCVCADARLYYGNDKLYNLLVESSSSLSNIKTYITAYSFTVEYMCVCVCFLGPCSDVTN